MTLVNPKPLGYAYGELLPSAHVNAVWSQLPLAIDGRGGSYTLSSPLVIGGSQPLRVTAELEALNDFTASGDIAFTGPAIVFGSIDFRSPTFFSVGSNPVFDVPSTFNAAVDMTAAATVRGVFTVGSAGSAFMNGPTQFFAPVQFQSGTDPVFNAPVTLARDVDAQRNVGLGGSGYTTTLRGPTVVASGAYITGRILVVGATLPSLVSTRDYDHVHISAAYVGGGTPILNISETSVPDNTRLVITTDSTSAVGVTSSLAAFGYLKNATGTTSGQPNLKRIELWRVSGAWLQTDARPFI